MKRFISQSIYKAAAGGPMPKIKLDSTELGIFNFLRDACEKIGMSNGTQPTVRVAGGWVRDKLLGVQSKDIDITVDVMGVERFADFLYMHAQETRGEKQTFVSESKEVKAQKTKDRNISVRILNINGQDVDLLPLRVEYYEPEDRHPITVNFQELTEIAQNEGIPRYLKRHRPDMFEKLSVLPPASRNDPIQVLPVVDAYRRDLTLNALFYNIQSGEVEDLTGRGLDDLREMKLSTPIEPNKTFEDDPLRVLRVLRFYSRFKNSHIDPETFEAMKNPGVQHQLTRRIHGDEESGITVERTAIELRKLFSGEQPDEAIRVMYETGLLGKVLGLPSEYSPFEMDQRNKHHELTLINHTLLVIKNMNKLSKEKGLSSEDRMMMNIASLFHDLGKLDPSIQKQKEEGQVQVGYGGHEAVSAKIYERLSDSLNLSNNEKTFIHGVVSKHMIPHDHLRGNVLNDPNKLREFKDKNPKLWEFTYLHAMADSISKSDTDIDPQIDPQYQQNIDLMQSFELPILVRGDEIIRRTGLQGPEIGQLLGKIREEQYKNFGLGGDQEIPFEQAKEFAMQMVKNKVQPHLDGNKIMQMTGLTQGRELGSVIQQLKEQRFNNPAFSEQNAIALVQQLYPPQQLPPEQV